MNNDPDAEPEIILNSLVEVAADGALICPGIAGARSGGHLGSQRKHILLMPKHGIVIDLDNANVNPV